jgi:hypothetical protein
MNIESQSAGHYYKTDGTAVHQVPKVSKGGGMRPTTIADARKLGLLPSVTTILSVMAKPGLDRYKQEAAILAALTLPRHEGESLDDFAARVVVDAKEKQREAMRIGTAVHDAAENYLLRGSTPADTQIIALFAPVKRWLDENVTKVYVVEKVLVNTVEGFAGTVDLICELKGVEGVTVLDFKTQGVKKDDKGRWKPVFYRDSWPLQLEAYRRTAGNAQNIASLVINTTEASDVWMKIWDKSEHEAFWKAFLSARDLWGYLKSYHPDLGRVIQPPRPTRPRGKSIITPEEEEHQEAMNSCEFGWDGHKTWK